MLRHAYCLTPIADAVQPTAAVTANFREKNHVADRSSTFPYFRLCTARGLHANERGSRAGCVAYLFRSEEHTSELQSLLRNSSAVFCLKQQTPTCFTTSRQEH